MRLLFLFLYYGFLRYLPANSFFIRPIGFFCGKLRYLCCKRIFKKCGKYVGIERLASFGSGKELVIGERSNWGFNCKVPSDIVLGNDVMMGPNFCCFTTNHCADRIDIPMNRQGTTPRCKFKIGNDVWIGFDVLMLPGAEISDGCVIAARSVVTTFIPEYSVAAGIPCRVIRCRKK